ncbi:MAG: PEP-CTERM sorting domain-containing protein [Trichormus sp. ATA11-4-KO1]|jgi:hypothetical protein|nr:PEP-CTERM sorting domain-containing protein [Trichormus sp. ATA11-4-KO1]
MLTKIKHSVLTASIVSFLSLSSLALANPSYAAVLNLDFNTWERIGDVTTTSAQATLNSGTNDTVVTGGGAGSLEEFLSIPAGSLDPDPDNFAFSTFGSAIRQTFTNVQVGDVFSFNWNFAIQDPIDSAFVTIDDSVIPLVNAPFSHTFLTAGTFNLGIGIVDVEDDFGKSQLIVSAITTRPVNEPVTLLGSFLILGYGVGMLYKSRKKTQISN